ncbi:hypothetical protein M569_10882, partial [Genlisea aurea]
VFLLCLLSGLSICWFNTVCFVLCIKNFPSTRPLALSLTVSFNGLSAALYNLIATSFSTSSSAIYLLLNALLPLITSLIALLPILRQPPPQQPHADVLRRDQLTFIKLKLLAVVTGFYLLLLHPTGPSASRALFAGAVFLLLLPYGIPGILYARNWFGRTVLSSFPVDGSGFLLVDDETLELHKELISRENSLNDYGDPEGCFPTDELLVLGIEHGAWMLVRRFDFWLYYVAYFCGGTIGLVYSNNLGQIAQSLGHSSYNPMLITIYSSFSFFGRLLSAAPDYARRRFYFARTGWLAIALIPTPFAFLLLTAQGDRFMAVEAGTGLIGLSSGFIFAAAVSITSELFGPESVGVNHNILITNIPIGSLLYGFMAATVYDSHTVRKGDSVVCMGRECYYLTFMLWGGISLLGLVSSLALFVRTRPAYRRFEQSRRQR